MMRADGDSIKAEQLMNCGIFEYFWRVDNYKVFSEERARQIKNSTK